MALCANHFCSGTVIPGSYCHKCGTYCPIEIKFDSPSQPVGRGAGAGNNVPFLLAFVAGIATYIVSEQDMVATVIAAIVGGIVGKTWVGKLIMAMLYLALGLLVLKFCGGLADTYR